MSTLLFTGGLISFIGIVCAAVYVFYTPSGIVSPHLTDDSDYAVDEVSAKSLDMDI